MSSPSAREPDVHEPQVHMPGICQLQVCEPLVVTLVLLILLLTSGQTLPAPFFPVPRPPALPTGSLPSESAAATGEPTAASAMTFTPEPTATESRRISPIPSAMATQLLATATAEPSPSAAASAAPTSTPGPAEPTPTLTAGTMPTADATPTTDATPTGEPTPTATKSAPGEPTATPDIPDWDLAQNIVGLWEHIDPEQRYYFDFLEGDIVFVAESGARTYAIEGERTIVIQMPGDAWMLTVRELSADRLVMEGVFGASDEFTRSSGIPNLQEALVGLWMDESDEKYPLEFTPGGIALGEFGRGKYRLASSSHLYIDCDDPDACSAYREHGQEEDAPLFLRVYELADGRITVGGLRHVEPWTLTHFDGHPALAADVVGLWESDDGTRLEFTGAGELLRDGNATGSYEVLSETTLWVSDDGLEEAWIVTELSADRLTYVEWDFFWDEPWVYSRVD